jgi:hypothetical protein
MGTDPAIGAILLEFDVIAVTTRDTKTWPLKTFRMLQRIVPLGKSLRTSHLATATAHAFVKIHSDLLCARKFDDHTGTGIHETTLLWIHPSVETEVQTFCESMKRPDSGSSSE